MRTCSCKYILFKIVLAMISGLVINVHAETTQDYGSGNITIQLPHSCFFKINNYDYSRYSYQVVTQTNEYSEIIFPDLDYGRYTIEVSRKNYTTFTDTIDLYAECSDVKVIPTIVKLKGQVKLTNLPNDMKISFSRSFYSRSFMVSPLNNLVELEYNTYTVHAGLPGYHPFKSSISIESPGPYIMDVTLSPVNKSAAVTRSLIFPGVGQLYSNQKLKGFGMVFFSIGSVLYLHELKKQYDHDQKSFDVLYDQYLVAGSVGTMKIHYDELKRIDRQLIRQRNRFKTVLLAYSVVYSINIYDIIKNFPKTNAYTN